MLASFKVFPPETTVSCFPLMTCFHGWMEWWNIKNSSQNSHISGKSSHCNPFLSQDMAFSLNTIPVHTLSCMLPLWCTCFMYNTLKTWQMSISVPDWTAYCYILQVLACMYWTEHNYLPLGVASLACLLWKIISKKNKYIYIYIKKSIYIIYFKSLIPI